METLFVGATTSRRSDAAGIFDPPRLPGNYTAGSVKALEYLEKAEAARRESDESRRRQRFDVYGDGKPSERGLLPCVDVVTSLVAVDQSGAVVFDIDRCDINAADVCYSFGAYIDRLPAAVMLVGFDLPALMRVLAVEASDKQRGLPITLWYRSPCVFDPLHVILGSHCELSLYGLFRHYGLDFTQDELSGSARSQADAARLLCEYAQIETSDIPALLASSSW